MSRDYKSRKSSTTSKNGSSLIWGLFIGYAMGLISAIGVWIYLSQAPSPFLSNEKLTDSPSTKQDISKAPSKIQPSITPEEKVAKVDEKLRFDFYKILPGIEEPVTEQEFKEAVQQPPPIKSQNSSVENYFLQVGSFKRAEEAENLKARLALLGMVSSIQSADLSEKGIWHRVRIGPFTDVNEVNQVRTSLQKNGIKANFIKVRENTR
ncbi:Sporulation related domain-containing protein [Nitrosomonas cryotolerans]|uniref:Sporulation related domain-containing protein n=1 Tax=Nitrosomonas cryotolerans ATCC 49181 TaxID=1131553 RepID=A0A1N6JBS0_9PROT|nr:SPOR domain-containing protein [Nitrosomonas cryotolerans]SFP48391.1 Sporulation related domain-containing protein [Nitrosomonas cryotolerans]SIO41730.1 Sporulation related domain-containing protein [Nitrosomonas cryotolerans ATCC 49181]